MYILFNNTDVLLNMSVTVKLGVFAMKYVIRILYDNLLHLVVQLHCDDVINILMIYILIIIPNWFRKPTTARDLKC